MPCPKLTSHETRKGSFLPALHPIPSSLTPCCVHTDGFLTPLPLRSEVSRLPCYPKVLMEETPRGCSLTCCLFLRARSPRLLGPSTSGARGSLSEAERSQTATFSKPAVTGYSAAHSGPLSGSSPPRTTSNLPHLDDGSTPTPLVSLLLLLVPLDPSLHTTARPSC